jgi:predicted transcriptional regulator of viral defense system
MFIEEKMTSSGVEKAYKIFKDNKGILRTAQANRLGIHAEVLARMVNEGLLVKEGKGLYRLTDLPPLTHPDFIQVGYRIPDAVICLISALNFHDLTTQIPNKVSIALPQGTKRPQIEYPPLDILWPVERIYSAGIEEYDIDGVVVKIYSKEKTVADCFRYSKKVGASIALEALKDYMRSPDYNLDLLYKYAQIDKIEKIIAPYIQAIIT